MWNAAILFLNSWAYSTNKIFFILEMINFIWFGNLILWQIQFYVKLCHVVVAIFNYQSKQQNQSISAQFGYNWICNFAWEGFFHIA